MFRSVGRIAQSWAAFLACALLLSGCAVSAEDQARSVIADRKEVFETLLLDALGNSADTAEAAEAINGDDVLGGDVLLNMKEPGGIDPRVVNYSATIVLDIDALDSDQMELLILFSGRGDQGNGLSAHTAVSYTCRVYVAEVGNEPSLSDSDVTCPIEFENLSRANISL